MATVYAVASAKGGVGKTTTTAAIATILADSGADVVAIDADLGMANLAGAVGVTLGDTTLHDVLAGQADPLDAVHDGPGGLRVVPGATDLSAYAAADPSGLRAVVEAFDDADYVFIDAGAGLSHDSTLPLGLADATLLVSTAERSALGDTEKTRQLTERLGGTVAGAAITRVGSDAEIADDITGTLDATVLGRIPEDPAVLRASTANEPLPAFAPDAPATRAYRDLARTLTGAEIEVLAPVDDGAGDVDIDDADDEGETDEVDDGDADDGIDEDRVGDEGDDETESEKAEPTERAAGSESAAPAEGQESAADDADSAADDEEDIIVADSEPAGLGDPVDEEDIIVAAESPVSEAEADDKESDVSGAIGDAEGDGDGDGDAGGDGDGDAGGDGNGHATDIDGATKTVGEDHVDADDLEAMIEGDFGDEETFDAGSDSVDVDDFAEEGSDGPEAETAAGDDGTDATEPDIDDELAESIPFRDDDTGTMNTALSEGDADETGSVDDASETEAEGDVDEARSESDEDGDGNEDEGGDDKGGFFSRLLGR